jgi:molecular chaperone GrpE|tara:strand:+ start:57717 stop:58283 length:567 start_codon:yes stop_codon:yes gene_type:complete
MEKRKKATQNEEYEFSPEDEIEAENRDLEKVKNLRAELKECTKEKQEYLTGWQRAKADFVNARKADEQKNADIKRCTQEEVIQEFLPVLDSFDLARGNKKAWDKIDSTWREGIEQIHTQLLSILRDRGVEVIDQDSVQFDPQKHDSIESVSTVKKEDSGIVASIIQKGYEMNGRALRAAKVSVYLYKE